jgi:hypothetical protein
LLDDVLTSATAADGVVADAAAPRAARVTR